MSAYRYEAARADGAVVSGLLDSPSAGQASAELTERGLYPITVVATNEDERRPAAGRRDLARASPSSYPPVCRSSVRSGPANE